MPKFDFQCSDCDKHFEKTVDVGDDKTPKCPHCKSENTKKILSAPGVIFKGKGFYSTDNKGGCCGGCCSEKKDDGGCC